MGAYRNEDGTLTFDTDYIGAWFEPQNEQVRNRLIGELASPSTHAVLVNFQPGDLSRYGMLLVAEPYRSITVSNDGRDPRYNDNKGDVVLAVMRTGNNAGVGRFLSSWSMDRIRSEIEAQMSVPNPCTREALAATIYVLWGEGRNSEA